MDLQSRYSVSPSRGPSVSMSFSQSRQSTSVSRSRSVVRSVSPLSVASAEEREVSVDRSVSVDPSSRSRSVAVSSLSVMSPPPPPPPPSVLSKKWYCVECNEVFCYGCVGCLHASGTRSQHHTLERIVPEPPRMVSAFFAPIVVFALLACLVGLFLVRPNGSLVGLAAEHCPAVNVVKTLAATDLVAFYHWKAYSAYFCDAEDSVWGFFEGAWVRGVLSVQDRWYLLLIQSSAAVFGFTVALVVAWVLCVPVAVLLTSIFFAETYFTKWLSERVELRGVSHAVRMVREIVVFPGALLSKMCSFIFFSGVLKFSARIIPQAVRAKSTEVMRVPPYTTRFGWTQFPRYFVYFMNFTLKLLEDTLVVCATVAFFVRFVGLLCAERGMASPVYIFARSVAGWVGREEDFMLQKNLFDARYPSESVGSLIDSTLVIIANTDITMSDLSSFTSILFVLSVATGRFKPRWLFL